MSDAKYYVWGEFNHEALVWGDKGWISPDGYDEGRAILFANKEEAHQCAAAVKEIQGGHPDHLRTPSEVDVNVFVNDMIAETVMSDELDEVWPEV